MPNSNLLCDVLFYKLQTSNVAEHTTENIVPNLGIEIFSNSRPSWQCFLIHDARIERCTNCGEMGHKSSCASLCKIHSFKTEMFTKNLGPSHRTFTSKLSFDQCVKWLYKGSLKAKMISTCKANWSCTLIVYEKLRC